MIESFSIATLKSLGCKLFCLSYLRIKFLFL